MPADGGRRGRRDNGLDAAAYVPLLDVDPRVGEHLLDVLGSAGVPAYLEPSADIEPYTRAYALPSPPTDRLWVDRERRSEARRIVDAENPDTPEATAARAGADDEPSHGLADSAEERAWQAIIASFNAPSAPHRPMRRPGAGDRPGTGTGSPGSGGTGTGTGSGTGLGPGTGSAPGTGAGSGTGSAPGTGSGTGTGKGSGGPGSGGDPAGGGRHRSAADADEAGRPDTGRPDTGRPDTGRPDAEPGTTGSRTGSATGADGPTTGARTAGGAGDVDWDDLPPWPGAEGSRPRIPGRSRPGTDPDGDDRDVPDGAALDAAAAARQAAEDDEIEVDGPPELDEGHFEPPPPPPVPRPSKRTVLGLLLIALALVFFIAPGVLGMDERTGFPLGILSVLGGGTVLVMGLRDTRGDDGPDDGAVV